MYTKGKETGKYQRNVIHVEHNHALVFGSILCYSTEVCLEDVVAIQEGHFAIRLDPDLVKMLGVVG